MTINYDDYNPYGPISTLSDGPFEWYEVLGNNLSASEIIEAAGTTDEQKLAVWIEDACADLWGENHANDSHELARQILREQE